eukprot:3784691-Pleurochrysis_carterae.AAC.1
MHCSVPPGSLPAITEHPDGGLQVTGDSPFALHTKCCKMANQPCWQAVEVDNRVWADWESNRTNLSSAIHKMGFRKKTASGCTTGKLEVSRQKNPSLFWDLRTCLQVVRTITSDKPYCGDEMIFHIYWSALRPVLPQIARLLGSFLATQNLERTQLWVWSPRDLTGDPNLKPFLQLPYIKVKSYNPETEIGRTPLANHPLRHRIAASVDRDRAWTDSDLARLLVLHNYGGVYLDGDTLLLRNFAPLLGREWAYTWGNDCTLLNNAFVRLFKGSKHAQRLLVMLAETRPRGTQWGPHLFERHALQDASFGVYPTCFFNPHWMAGCVGCTPHGSSTPALWNGPFGIHLHGGVFEAALRNSSDYCRVNEAFGRRLAKRGWLDIARLLPC